MSRRRSRRRCTLGRRSRTIGTSSRYAQPDYKGVGKAAKEMIDKSKREPGVHHLPTRGAPDMYFIKGDRILFLADKMQPAEEGEGGWPRS